MALKDFGFFFAASADEEKLKCYQCRVERNEDCTDADLKPCPDDQAYDVCLVSVTNNGEYPHSRRFQRLDDHELWEEMKKKQFPRNSRRVDSSLTCLFPSVISEGHVFIEKKCALGPCDLRDQKQAVGLGLDTCDRSRNTYSCFECCKGSGCNKSSAYGLRASSSSFMLIISLSLAVLARLFTFGQFGGAAAATAAAARS